MFSRRRHTIIVSSALLLLSACVGGGSHTSPEDGGADSASDDAQAVTPDAEVGIDAGSDGGDLDAANDAGERLDAGGTPDASGCAMSCDDGNACTVDACSQVTGQCTHRAPPETCDGTDNDCDGSVDEDLPTFPTYPDQDSDGFGDSDGNAVLSCSLLPGYARNNTDCNDSDAEISPRLSEACDNKDNDCDHITDEDRACAGGTPCALALELVCDPVATCREVGGNAACACPSGFLDISSGSATGISCVDIDECRSSSLNTCDANATCANAAGSFTCTCNEGFGGDGTTCVPN